MRPPPLAEAISTALVAVKCGTGWKRIRSGPTSSSSSPGSYSRISNAFSIRSSLPQAPTTRRNSSVAPGGTCSSGRAGCRCPASRDRHRLLARRVGQRVGERHEVEEVVGVQVRDHDRVDVDVVDEAPQLGEHAVAAVEQQVEAVLLDQVAAAGPVRVLPGRRLAEHGDAHVCEALPLGELAGDSSPVSLETVLLVLGGLLMLGALVAGLVRRSFLSLAALFVADRLRARRGRPGGARLRRALGLRARPRGRRADRDPVPRRARGRGRDAPARVAPAVPQARARDADHRRVVALPPRTGSSASTGSSRSCSARCCRRPTRCSPPRWSPTRACRGSCATRSTSSPASTTGSRCRRCSPSRRRWPRGRLRLVGVRAPGRDARLRVRHRARRGWRRS